MGTITREDVDRAFNEEVAAWPLLGMGVDIGQRRDPTAIAVAETEDRPAAWSSNGGAVAGDRALRTKQHYLVRYLERLKLSTPYPEVAARVAAVARGIVERTGEEPTLYVDAPVSARPLSTPSGPLGLRRALSRCTSPMATEGCRNRMNSSWGRPGL